MPEVFLTLTLLIAERTKSPGAGNSRRQDFVGAADVQVPFPDHQMNGRFNLIALSQKLSVCRKSSRGPRVHRPHKVRYLPTLSLEQSASLDHQRCKRVRQEKERQ